MEDRAAKPRSERFREWTQFLLIVFAGFWGAYTFVYKEIWVPARRPAALTMSANLEQAGRQGTSMLVRARVHLLNKRENRIYAPAVWFTVTGMQLTPTAPAGPDQPSPEANAQPLPDMLSRYSSNQEHFVAAWKQPDWRTWYDPQDETTDEELFLVPVDLYQALRLKVEVMITKDITAVSSVDWNVNGDGSLAPTLMMKGPGSGDAAAAEAFDADGNPRHARWAEKYGAGHNLYVTTLSLLAGGTPEGVAK